MSIIAADVKPVEISRREAGLFLLEHQQLLPPRNLRGKEGIIQYIKHTGCIQFDPLNRVGRNPDLVLQARIKDYKPAMLAELLYTERRLLDGWDKNMSIYQVNDWPYFKRYRERAGKRLGCSSRPAAAILPRVRKDLRERGPLSSIDLKYDRVVDWSWAPTRLARAALESMYSWGELIIHHKVGTRKVYDFADEHLPEKLLASPEPNHSEREYLRWRVLRRVGGIGLVHARTGSDSTWLGIDELNSKKLRDTVAGLLEDNKLMEIKVEGILEPLYIRTGDKPLLEKISADMESSSKADREKQVSFLAPLDNLLWDRNLIREIFQFDYVWEVYKPVSRREYGYYVLPVLYGDRFIARFEPVLDKKAGELLIKNWWWEPEARDYIVRGKMEEDLEGALAEALKEFQDYLGAVRLNTGGLDGKEISHIEMLKNI